MTQLSNLLYTSDSLIKTDDVAKLIDMVDGARRANALHGVTGALLLSDRRFIQLIEGEATKIDTLFKNIRKDARHENIKLVFKSSISVRRFGSWSMAFATPSSVPSELGVRFLSDLKADESQKAQKLLTLLGALVAA